MARRRTSPGISLFAFQDVITSITGIILLVAIILAIQFTIQAAAPAPETSGLHETVAALRQTIEQDQLALEQLQQQLVAGTEAATEAAGISEQQLEQQEKDLDAELASLEQQLEELDTARKAAQEELIQQKAKEFDQQGKLAELERIDEEIAELQAELEELENSTRRSYRPRLAPGQRGWLVQVDGHQIMIAEIGVEAAPLIFDQDSEEERAAAFADWFHKHRDLRGHLYIYIKPGGCRVFDEIISLIRRSGWQHGYDLLGVDEDEIDIATGVKS